MSDIGDSAEEGMPWRDRALAAEANANDLEVEGERWRSRALAAEAKVAAWEPIVVIVGRWVAADEASVLYNTSGDDFGTDRALDDLSRAWAALPAGMRP